MMITLWCSSRFRAAAPLPPVAMLPEAEIYASKYFLYEINGKYVLGCRSAPASGC